MNYTPPAYRVFLAVVLPLLGGARWRELRRFEIARRLLSVADDAEAKDIRIAYVGRPQRGPRFGPLRTRWHSATAWRRAFALALWQAFFRQQAAVVLAGFALLMFFI